MGWILWPLVAGLVVALLAWCFWEFVHKRGRVGKTDLSYAIYETLLTYQPGTTISLRSIRSNATVVFTKRDDEETRAPLLDLFISGQPANSESSREFVTTLSLLGLQYTAGDCAPGELRTLIRATGVKREVWGRVVEHALLAAGMLPGEQYRYEFRGDSDLEALTAFAERKRAGLE